jgi:hypothetical protein
MNAIELLRKKLLEEAEAKKKDTELKSSAVNSKVKFIPREQITRYFDTVVIPAFEQIRDELLPFSFRVFIRMQVFTAQLTVREPDASAYFKISLKNKEPMIIEMLYHYGSAYVHMHRKEVVFFREILDLGDYKSITREKLIEMFTENFIIRREHPESLRKENEQKEIEEQISARKFQITEE